MNEPPKTEASKPDVDPSKKWEPVTRRTGYRGRQDKRKGTGRNNGQSPHKAASTTPKTKFVGRTTEIKNHVFTTGTNSGSIFSKSKKEILHHIEKRSPEVERAITEGTEHVFKIPVMPQVPNTNYDPDSVVIGAEAEPEFIDKPEKDFNLVDTMMLQAEIKNYQTRTMKYEIDRKWAYTIIRGNCSDDMIVKLNTYENYKQIHSSLDPVKLLSLIQRICFNYQNQQMPVVSMYDAILKLCSMRQRGDESMTDFHNRFTDNKDIVSACGSTLITDCVRRN